MLLGFYGMGRRREAKPQECKCNNGLRIETLRPLPVDCWDWTEAFALEANARAVAEDPSPGLGRTYLGAGAQGPQASVTSRIEQLE